jgi:TusA-related sulfurtransferase
VAELVEPVTSDIEVPSGNVADLSGYTCPMVVRLAARFVSSLPRGSIALVISTDPQAQIDIPAWVWDSKNKLLREVRDDGSWRFFIEVASWPSPEHRR